MMRLRLLLALFLVGPLHVVCQGAAHTAPASNLLKDPRAFFEAAVPHYDFSDSKLKPWHLKASYQIYDYEGKLATQGTWEYWWGSPKVRRRSLERLGLTDTEWITEDGTVFRKRSGESLHYFESELEDIILYPGPNYEMIDSGKLKLGLKKVGDGSTSLTCLTTVRQQEIDGRLQFPPQATPDYYCFDPGTMALLTTYINSDSATTQYSQFVKIQDHYIARKISVQIGKQTMLSVSVESIVGIETTDQALVRAADATPTQQPANYTFDNPAAEHIVAGKLLKKSQPIYPQMAKSQHIQGVVLINARIGTDGKIRHQEVLASPSPLLAESAVECVKEWEYAPNTINGQPIEVETLIHVIFTLGS